TVTVDSSWRQTGATRVTSTGGQELQLLMNLQITNRGATPITVSDLVARADLGMQLPIFVQFVSPRPIVVPDHATSSAIALVWLPIPFANHLRDFELML